MAFLGDKNLFYAAVYSNLGTYLELFRGTYFVTCIVNIRVTIVRRSKIRGDAYLRHSVRRSQAIDQRVVGNYPTVNKSI